MKAGKLNVWLLALICCSALFGAAAAAKAQSPGNGIDSVANSYVYLNHAISPDDCSMRNAPQTFCFQAISQTDDNDYIYYLWMRFPPGWTVHDVALSDTPYCTNGGTFAGFSYWEAAENEGRITHVRYQANPSDACTAFYCFQVTPEIPTPARITISYPGTGKAPNTAARLSSRAARTVILLPESRPATS